MSFWNILPDKLRHHRKGLFIWLENPLQIKLSTGIKQDKNDRTDSRDIALYAFQYQDRARRYQLPDATFKSLALLLSFRERLLQTSTSFWYPLKKYAL